VGGYLIDLEEGNTTAMNLNFEAEEKERWWATTGGGESGVASTHGFAEIKREGKCPASSEKVTRKE